MGIKQLARLIGDNAPRGVKDVPFEGFFGRKLAIDASMHIYQFMAVVGRSGEATLMNEAGEVTAHLNGMLYRTARFIEAGIKPIYVFDGKAPELKSGELTKRREKREEAQAQLAEAKEKGDAELIEKFAKRDLRVTREHNEECKRLLRLMGVPVIESPGEAEAQCAELVRQGLAYAAVTEDMDCLTFGAPVMCRQMMVSGNSKDLKVNEFHLETILSELGLTQEQFIDMCILCGCDYMDTIPGIGPKRALELVRKWGSMEEILENLDESKFKVPENFPYKEARALFLAPDVQKEGLKELLQWGPPDEEGLVEFLVKEKDFREERIRSVAKKLADARGKSTQGRLESFFGPVTVKQSERKGAADAGKKRAGVKMGGAVAKKGKLGGFGKKK